jgi:MFS family permease
VASSPTNAPTRGLGGDFWKFWVGQAISNLGSSFTLFALPLLVYQLTGSALNLGLMTAVEFLPYVLFGLVLGAWADRVDRKHMMILTDVARAAIIASIPLLAGLDLLLVWWIYAVGFISSTLKICFDAGEFAAVPSLVGKDGLIKANGRIQASYSAAFFLGPFLAGALLVLMPVQTILLFDALSFLASALALALVTGSFNVEGADKKTLATLREDVVEGLRYVLSHPVLRNISIMMALINFLAATTHSQLVLFAKERLGASDSQVGLLYSAGALGVAVLSLAADPVRKRLSFSKAALGALMLYGLLIFGLAFVTFYWIAVPVWALA